MTVAFARRQCVVRLGGASVRMSLRAVVVVGALLAGAAVLAVVAVGVGKYQWHPPTSSVCWPVPTRPSTGWWFSSGACRGC